MVCGDRDDDGYGVGDDGDCALRVSPAETWLTVYRRLRVCVKFESSISI